MKLLFQLEYNDYVNYLMIVRLLTQTFVDRVLFDDVHKSARLSAHVLDN